MRVLSTSVMTRGITDCGIAIGAAAALGLGVWRVAEGVMTIEALLIVLRAARGRGAWLGAEPLVPTTGRTAGVSPALGRRDGSGPEQPRLAPTIAFEDVHFAYPGGRQAAHDRLAFAVAAGEEIGSVGPG